MEEKNMYPYEITKPNNDKYIIGEDVVQIGPQKFCFHSSFREHAEGYYNLEVKKDDVWIVSYTRSGTNWTQEMMWLLTHDLDYEKAKSLHFNEKFMFLEQSTISVRLKQRMREELKSDEKIMEHLKKLEVPGYEAIKTMDTPRCIKTHLPLSILPPNLVSTAKVVYVARHPKDCAVSNFYFNTGKWAPVNFEGEFEQYWSLFQDGLVLYGPHNKHVKEGWELRNHQNILFLFYEELKQDLPGMIRKVAAFLNKEISDEDVDAMVNHLSFENMKSAESNLPFSTMKHAFLREGKVGYEEEFKNIGKKADEWVENLIKTSGIPFQTPRANATDEKLSE